MFSAIPTWLADLGAGSGAIAATIGLILLVGGLIARAWRKAAKSLHDSMVETIKAEVPAAVAAEMPRALEPHTAELRGQLVELRRELFAQLSTVGEDDTDNET